MELDTRAVDDPPNRHADPRGNAESVPRQFSMPTVNRTKNKADPAVSSSLLSLDTPPTAASSSSTNLPLRATSVSNRPAAQSKAHHGRVGQSREDDILPHANKPSLAERRRLRPAQETGHVTGIGQETGASALTNNYVLQNLQIRHVESAGTGARQAPLPSPRSPGLHSPGLGGLPSPSLSSLKNGTYRSRPTSRGSTFSETSAFRSGAGKKKLSSESWVKNLGQEETSPEVPRRGLRRVSSKESLRPKKFEPVLVPVKREVTLQISPPAEDLVLARTTNKLAAPRERLFLRDSPIEENKVLLDGTPTPQPAPARRAPSPPNTSRPPPIQENKVLLDAQSITQTPLTIRSPSPSAPKLATVTRADAENQQATPPRKMSAFSQSPISDSIPTRTSSLRQTTTSSSSTKRKERKSKPSTNPTKDGQSQLRSVFARRSKPIPESSWADLGEDDETVKRIRELRLLRESRLKQSQSATVDGPVPDTVEVKPPFEDSPLRSSIDTGANNRRRTPSRAATEPTRVQQVSDLKDYIPPGMNNLSGFIFSDDDFDLQRRSKETRDDRLAPMVPQRSLVTPELVHTPDRLSLDYSYSDAVSSLQGNDPAAAQPRILRVASHEEPIILTPSTQTAVRSLSAQPSPRQPDKSRTVNSSDLERRKSRRRSMGGDSRRRNLEDDVGTRRRDSLEASVGDFLQAPRLNQRVHNPIAKRWISFSEVGDPKGSAVFVCVGMGLTRYVTAFYDELATTLRLRLITLDRPGVGGSDPYPPSDKSGPLNWPEDVLMICQYLGITKFSIMAHSAGAIYGLATALIFPQMVIGKVHLLAPWIPPSQLEAIPHQTSLAAPAGSLPRSQRLLRVLPTTFLKAANSSFLTGGNGKPTKQRPKNPRLGRQDSDPISPSSPRDGAMSPDRSVDNRRESMMLMDRVMPGTNPLEAFPEAGSASNLTDEPIAEEPVILSATAMPTDPSFTFAAAALNAAEHTEKERQALFTRRLTERTWDLATRDSNPATDLLVCLERHRDIGFRYTDVNREVVITHGAEDKRVPANNIRWLAAQMNRHSAAGTTRPSSNSQAPSSRDGWADPMRASRGCEVRILPGEGHGLMASAAIMGDILTEIAGYWSSHNRAQSSL